MEVAIMETMGGSGSSNNNGGGSSLTDKTGGQSGTQNVGKVDTTLSPTNLPATGKALIIIFIGVILLIGILVFIRYEVLNRYVK